MAVEIEPLEPPAEGPVSRGPLVRSPTAGTIAQLQLGKRNPGLVRIPPGVWHADQNWGDTLVRIVNFPTRAYDPENPDKHRIDPHSGVIPFDWTLRDG
jgi:dTDP-4-dehydrorhamnose 3,5-epimerase